MNLFGASILIFPIHSKSHWHLAVIDLSKECFFIYDSLVSNSSVVCLNFLRRWLEDLTLIENYHVSKSPIEWPQTYIDIPQQENSHDCGVFMLLSAVSVVLADDRYISQADIPTARHRILLEILQTIDNVRKGTLSLRPFLTQELLLTPVHSTSVVPSPLQPHDIFNDLPPIVPEALYPSIESSITQSVNPSQVTPPPQLGVILSVTEKLAPIVDEHEKKKRRGSEARQETWDLKKLLKRIGLQRVDIRKDKKCLWRALLQGAGEWALRRWSEPEQFASAVLQRAFDMKFEPVEPSLAHNPLLEEATVRQLIKLVSEVGANAVVQRHSKRADQTSYLQFLKVAHCWASRILERPVIVFSLCDGNIDGAGFLADGTQITLKLENWRKYTNAILLYLHASSMGSHFSLLSQ